MSPDTGKPPIPGALDDITADWITTAFRSTGLLDTERVTNASLTPLTDTSGQDGLYGLFDLDYDREVAGQLPSRVFAKITALSPEEKRTPKASQPLMERVFYRDFGPSTSARIPRFYYGDFDPETIDNVLVIQSLDGWTTGDTSTGIGPEEAMSVSRELAKLHASTLNSPVLEKPHPFINMAAPEMHERLGKRATEGWTRHRDALDGLFTPQLVKLCDSILESFGGLNAEFESHSRSLNHGDCRIDNMAFRRGRSETETMLFDWGLATVGNGFRDLGLSLATGAQEPTLRIFQDAVEEYRSVLNSYEKCDISATEAWHDFLTAVGLAICWRLFFLAAVTDLDADDPVSRMRWETMRRISVACEVLELDRSLK